MSQTAKDFCWVLWWATVSVVAVMVCQSLAHGQVATPQRTQQLRTYLPTLDDPDMQKVLDDKRLILYTEREMPKVFQQPAGDGPPLWYSAYDNIAAEPDPHGQGNNEFPWRDPAGSHNQASVRFVWLPEGRPIVYWWERLPATAINEQASLNWIYPVGAIVGEVLLVTDPQGKFHGHEVRVRIRRADAWEPRVYRPYVSPESLAARIKQLRPDSPQAQAAAVQVLKPLSNETKTLADNHPRRQAFRETAATDVLPPLDPKHVNELLDTVSFTEVTGLPWKESGNVKAHAPTSTGGYSIVPPGYQGNFVPVDQKSCTRCHETTGHHVDEFAVHNANYGGHVRHWYGRIRGSDGIFSLHPIDARDRRYRAVSVRRDLVAVGMFAAYNPEQHPKHIYGTIPEFDPKRVGPVAKTGGRVVRGGY